METKRVIVGVTGASGMPYAAHLLAALASAPGVETHVILSDAAKRVLALETDLMPADLTDLAHAVHEEGDLGAPPASGSWRAHGMVVCPCSMKSLAAIAHGLAGNLIHRAADVCLKERRPLILVARETPFSTVHLENMLAVSRAGATVMPPAPGFYHRPAAIGDLLAFMSARILDHLGVEHALSKRWGDDT